MGINHQSLRCHKKLNSSLITLAREPTLLLVFIGECLQTCYKYISLLGSRLLHLDQPPSSPIDGEEISLQILGKARNRKVRVKQNW